jgi:hypothetical protein
MAPFAIRLRDSTAGEAEFYSLSPAARKVSASGAGAFLPLRAAALQFFRKEDAEAFASTYLRGTSTVVMQLVEGGP